MKFVGKLLQQNLKQEMVRVGSSSTGFSSVSPFVVGNGSVADIQSARGKGGGPKVVGGPEFRCFFGGGRNVDSTING